MTETLTPQPLTLEPQTPQEAKTVRHPKYMSRDSHIGPRTVRFIPVKDGDVVELGDTAGLSSQTGWTRRPPHIILGFKRRESQGRSLRAAG